jgi:hypothetical protein
LQVIKVIAKSYITTNLTHINRKYLQATSHQEALFFSKLAILELCGWIEESMDDIILRCATRHLKKVTNRDYCEKDIVAKTFGFDYDRNFRFMLIRLVGLINVEVLESKVDTHKLASLVAALQTLKAQRNKEAHTHVKGVTRNINAPSLTMAQFQPLYEGLCEFDRVIRKRRW